MKKLTALFLFALLLMTLVSAAYADELPVMQLHQISLGCADGYVMIAGDKVMLVDCGSDSQIKHYPFVQMQYFQDIGLDHVDRYFVTHYHNDHAMNVDVFMEEFATEDTVLYGPSRELPRVFKKPERGRYQQLKDDDAFTFGDFEVTCIGPASADASGFYNNDSLNFIVKYGEISILFTGDYVHDSVITRHADLLGTVDILKFPHHGLMPYAISPDALKLMTDTCKVVLFPANNPSGTLIYLKDNGLGNAQRYSGNDGNVVILTNGKDLEVYTDVTPGAYGLGYDGGM